MKSFLSRSGWSASVVFAAAVSLMAFSSTTAAQGSTQIEATAFNTLHNAANVYTPADTTVQTPNSDTPYSFIGLDLRAEPLILTLPAIESKRYYSVQFADQYTYNIAYLGSRTTGNGGCKFLIVGPHWTGATPNGIAKVIRFDTEFGMVLFRTQLFGPSKFPRVGRPHSCPVPTLSPTTI
jgi:hypothetical protein